MRFHFGSLYYLLKILTNKKMLKFVLTVILFVLILLFMKNYKVSAYVNQTDNIGQTLQDIYMSYQDRLIDYAFQLNTSNHQLVVDFINRIRNYIFPPSGSQQERGFVVAPSNITVGGTSYMFGIVFYDQPMINAMYSGTTDIIVNGTEFTCAGYTGQSPCWGLNSSLQHKFGYLDNFQIPSTAVFSYSSRWGDLFNAVEGTNINYTALLEQLHVDNNQVINKLSEINNKVAQIVSSSTSTQQAINQQGQATQQAINQQGQATQQAINQQGQATQSAINSQTQQQQQQYEESLNDSYQNVDIDLPSDSGLNDVTADGINNIFQRVQNAFLSDSHAEINFHIPFFDVDYQISNTWVRSIYSQYLGVLYNWAQMFWIYIISMIVIKDMSRFYDRLKSGSLDHNDINVKTEIL